MLLKDLIEFTNNSSAYKNHSNTINKIVVNCFYVTDIEFGLNKIILVRNSKLNLEEEDVDLLINPSELFNLKCKNSKLYFKQLKSENDRLKKGIIYEIRQDIYISSTDISFDAY